MPMPRLVAMYGPVGYRYSGILHPSRRLAPRLEVIRRRVEAVTGRVFNSVLANLYRDGCDSVGWHRDSDYAHGGQPDIASVSFGATRRFELRDGSGGRAAEDLASGSLLLITGDAVSQWWHRVPKTSRPVAPRCAIRARARAALLSPARREQAGDGLSSLHVPRRDEGARRNGPRLRRLEPLPAAGAGRSGGLARGPPARGTCGP